jgi:CheY-like chemotaxis protein
MRRAAASDSDTILLAGKRALIVDDDDDARCLLRTALEECQMTVCDTDSVEAALAALDEASFDVVISDIGMPDRDGYSLIRAVRARPGGISIPAVALTSFSRSEDRTVTLLEGFDRHFDKPLQASLFIRGLASLLGRLSARNSQDGG